MDMNKVIRIEHKNPAGSQHTLIECSLGNKCNYACSYCPVHLHDGSVGWHAYDDMIRFLDGAESHYRQGMGKTLMIQYTGGEPTLHPKFRDLVRHAHAKEYMQGMISNASRTIRFWESVREYFTKVSFTFHREFANIEHYMDVVRCVSEVTHVHCNVTMIPEEFDNNLDLANELWELPNVTVLLKPLREEFKGDLYPYTDAQLSTMANSQGRARAVKPTIKWPQFGVQAVYEDGTTERCHVNQMVINKETRWKGWECAAGIEQLIVDVNGEVFIGRCRVGGSLGNLKDGVNFPDENVICTKDYCWCLTDVLTTKIRKT